MFIKCLDSLEIKTILFSLNGNNALVPDGFGDVFYHSY